MSRILNATLDNDAFTTGLTHATLDLTYGGMQGWCPDLTQWISNQSYVRRNMICIVLEAPAFFQLMPDPAKWVQCLRSLLELHAKSIEGMQAGLKVDFDDSVNVGGSGEIQQEVTNVTRDRSEPSFSFVEKYGMPIQTFIYNWITYGMMDPDAKYAMVGTLAGTKPADMLADWFTCSCLFIEPDPTHRFVMKSWVTTNMMPKETGEIIGKRDLSTAGEISNLTIPFTGLSQTGLGTNLFAQAILNSININNANPNLRPSFIQGINPDVAAAQSAGYSVGASDLGLAAVPGIT